MPVKFLISLVNLFRLSQSLRSISWCNFTEKKFCMHGESFCNAKGEDFPIGLIHSRRARNCVFYGRITTAAT